MSHSSRHNKPHEPRFSNDGPKPGADAANNPIGSPTTEHIRLRAYEISQVRGGGAGNAQTDWVQAEHELGAGLDGKR